MTILLFVGESGSGKTTSCNKFAEVLGASQGMFTPGHGLCSETSDPQEFSARNVTFVDTPGLLDTSGRDEGQVCCTQEKCSWIRDCSAEHYHSNLWFIQESNPIAIG